jgi:hypothetical protein
MTAFGTTRTFRHIVLVGDGAERGWQREHHMEIRHRQQVGLARRHFGQCRLRQEL